MLRPPPRSCLRALALGLFLLAGFSKVSSAAWQTFDAASGLATTPVDYIVQDSTGAMWFGSHTQTVLTKYDGLRWQTFPVPSFASGIGIDAITPLRDGGIAFAYETFTGDGVERVDPSGTIHLDFPIGPSTSVFGMTQAPDGTLWLATGGVVVDSLSFIKSVPPLPAGMGASAITSSDNGDIWINSVYRGAARYRDGAWKPFGRAEGLPSDTVSTIFCDREGGVWFATAAGVAHLDAQGQWRTYTTADGLPAYYIYSFVEDGSGGIWGGGGYSSNLIRFDGLRWRTYGQSDGVPSYVSGLGADREGNLWLGTNSSVLRFDRVLQRELGGSGQPLFEDPQGRIWSDSGVRFDQNQFQAFAPGVQDREGRIWGGGCNEVTRFDGDAWHPDSLSALKVSGCVGSPAEDAGGHLWFAGVDSTFFLWEFDGQDWHLHRAPAGFPPKVIARTFATQRSGSLWMAVQDSSQVGYVPPFASSLLRYEPKLDRWTLYGRGDGVPAYYFVSLLLEDHAGNLWATGSAQFGKFDGAAWTTYDHPATELTIGMQEDRTGTLWAVLDNYLLRFDGSSWLNSLPGLSDPNIPSLDTYYGGLGKDASGEIWAVGRPQDLPTLRVVVRLVGDEEILETTTTFERPIIPPILEDHAGTIWSSYYGQGFFSYDRDRTAPQTVLVSGPPKVGAQRRVAFSYLAAYGEPEKVEFRSAVDGADTTVWSAQVSRELTIPDGHHTFEVWARDHIGNVDPTPARSSFEVDGTPPTAIVSSPAFGAIVRGEVAVDGEADDARFKSWSLDIRSTDSSSWTPLASSSTPAPKGSELARFESHGFSDGEHLLRLSVSDTLGLTGVTQVSVVIDNYPPSAEQSSPVVVRRAQGGDVFTTDGTIHLYIPPYALSHDDTVGIAPRVPGQGIVPPDSAQAPFDLRWSSGALSHPAVLSVTIPDSLASRSPAVWDSVDASGWKRLGGTVDGSKKQITAAITESGTYRLSMTAGNYVSSIALSPLALLPRVFSPSGGFASQEVAITFSLGRPASVTVRVYNRAGRLVKEVGAGIPMQAGANVVRWNGHDRDGDAVQDGLYLVTVDALGEREQSTVAVVR